MKATIKFINDKIGESNGQYGPMRYIRGEFTDGSKWMNSCKAENLDKRLNAIKELVGKEAEFTGETKTNQYGTEFTFKTLPGQQPFGGGGFGGGGAKTYTVAWANTRDGEMYRCASIQAQVAIKTAAELCIAGKFAEDETLVVAADMILGWLKKNTPAPAEAPKQEPPAQMAPPPSAGNDRDKAVAFLKEKISALEECVSPGGLAILAENAKTLRERLKAKGFTDLMNDLDAAISRASDRLNDCPF